jgi:hypothetical protein
MALPGEEIFIVRRKPVAGAGMIYFHSKPGIS